MKKPMKAYLQGKGRYVLYLAALVCLMALTVLALWRVTGSGAYLTDEGDWQDLAGTYRVGIIDYEVTVNAQSLAAAGDTADGNSQLRAKMLVPLMGGVQMFDTTVSTAVREQEFNEGATLIRVRVENRSDTMVEVTSAFQMAEQSVGEYIRVLPLPDTLTEVTARQLNCREYVLNTLKPYNTNVKPASLAELESAYKAYHAANPEMLLDMGILPGAVSDPTVEGGRRYSHKDVFLLAWSEYGSAEYNSALTTGEAQARWGRLKAVFTVGQME